MTKTALIVLDPEQTALDVEVALERLAYQLVHVQRGQTPGVQLVYICPQHTGWLHFFQDPQQNLLYFTASGVDPAGILQEAGRHFRTQNLTDALLLAQSETEESRARGLLLCGLMGPRTVEPRLLELLEAALVSDSTVLRTSALNAANLLQWPELENALTSCALTESQVSIVAAARQVLGSIRRAVSSKEAGTEPDTREDPSSQVHTPLPQRPALGRHVQPRVHWIDGKKRFLLYHEREPGFTEISEEEWDILHLADGTRDIDGLLLAASLHGKLRTSVRVVEILAGLNEQGLLADGITPMPRPPQRGTRPVESLPDYRFECSNAGACCTTYSTVPVGSSELQCGVHRIPTVTHGDLQMEVKLSPTQGASKHLQSLPLRDGACVFHRRTGPGVEGICTLQEKLGPEAKPAACRLFPAFFVGDERSIRQSVLIECACVIRSVGATEGQPLGPAGVETEQDLPSWLGVKELPALLKTSENRQVTATDLGDWLDAIAEDIRTAPCVVTRFLQLAEMVDQEGLKGPETARQYPVTPLAVLEPRLQRVSRECERHGRRIEYRSNQDRNVRLLKWMRQAVEEGTESLLSTVLSEAGARELLPGVQPALGVQERFYAHVSCWGRQLVSGSVTVGEALRDRAVRLTLGRLMATAGQEHCPDDASLSCPITAVETLMRQGLDEYLNPTNSIR